MKNLLTISLLLLALISCTDKAEMEKNMKPQKEETQSLNDKLNANSVNGYDLTKDLKYGSDNFQAYDLYTPKTTGNAKSPVMVVIHGGGWSLLDKSFMNLQVNEFLKENKNMTIFNINHRLAGVNGYTYSDIIADLDLVMQEINRKKIGLNLSNDIILYGYSSGGHLALEYSKLRKNNTDIKAVAASAPPTDLTSEGLRKSIIDDKNRNLTELLIGEPYSQNPGAYKEASPIFKVSSSSKPTIIFHGNKDDIVSTDQVSRMIDLLSRNGVQNKFVEFQNVGHEFQNKQADISKEVFNFFKQL